MQIIIRDAYSRNIESAGKQTPYVGGGLLREQLYFKTYLSVVCGIRIGMMLILVNVDPAKDRDGGREFIFIYARTMEMRTIFELTSQ